MWPNATCAPSSVCKGIAVASAMLKCIFTVPHASLTRRMRRPAPVVPAAPNGIMSLWLPPARKTLPPAHRFQQRTRHLLVVPLADSHDGEIKFRIRDTNCYIYICTLSSVFQLDMTVVHVVGYSYFWHFELEFEVSIRGSTYPPTGPDHQTSLTLITNDQKNEVLSPK